jgi:hypothetical protein
MDLDIDPPTQLNLYPKHSLTETKLFHLSPDNTSNLSQKNIRLPAGQDIVGGHHPEGEQSQEDPEHSNSYPSKATIKTKNKAVMLIPSPFLAVKTWLSPLLYPRLHFLNNISYISVYNDGILHKSYTVRYFYLPGKHKLNPKILFLNRQLSCGRNKSFRLIR